VFLYHPNLYTNMLCTLICLWHKRDVLPILCWALPRRELCANWPDRERKKALTHSNEYVARTACKWIEVCSHTSASENPLKHDTDHKCKLWKTGNVYRMVTITVSDIVSWLVCRNINCQCSFDTDAFCQRLDLCLALLSWFCSVALFKVYVAQSRHSLIWDFKILV